MGNHYPVTCRRRGSNPGRGGDKRGFYHCAFQCGSPSRIIYRRPFQWRFINICIYVFSKLLLHLAIIQELGNQLIEERTFRTAFSVFGSRPNWLPYLLHCRFWSKLVAVTVTACFIWNTRTLLFRLLDKFPCLFRNRYSKIRASQLLKVPQICHHCHTITADVRC